MKQSILYALFSALITAVFITGAPAFGQSVGETETYVSLVRTADLDLASDAGKRQLDQRVARAAREVCGVASDVNIEGKNDVRKCREDAIARATYEHDGILSAADRGAIIAVTATR